MTAGTALDDVVLERSIVICCGSGGVGKTTVSATFALAAARALVASGLHSLPWEGLKLAHGDPAIPTVYIRV